MSGTACWLCGRPLGRRFEYHHQVPKSLGGRDLVPLHAVCHRTLHARYSNKELAAIGGDRPRLVSDPDITRFLAWIANKPPDFHSITHKRRRLPNVRGWPDLP